MPKATVTPTAIKTNTIAASTNKNVAPVVSKAIVESKLQQSSASVIAAPSQIVKLDTTNIKVTNISADGKVTLSVDSKVNIASAVKNNVNTFSVELKKSETDVNSISPAKLSPSKIIENITGMMSNAKKEETNTLSSVIKNANIDITSVINNKLANALSAKTTENFEKIIPASIVLMTIPANNDSREMSEIPILQTPKTSAASFIPASDKTDKQIMTDMILKDGISPASAAKAQLTFTTSETAIAGTTNANKKSTNIIDSAGPALTTDKVRSNNLVGSLLSGKIQDVSSANDLKGSTTKEETSIVVLGKESTEIKTITKQIILTQDEINSLGGSINLNINVGNGKVAQSARGCCISLSNKITDFLFDNTQHAESIDGKTLTMGENKNNSVTTNSNKNDKQSNSSEKNTLEVSTDIKGTDKTNSQSALKLTPPSGGGGTPPSVMLLTKTFSPLTPVDNSWKPVGVIAAADKETLKKATEAEGTTKVVRIVKAGHSPYPPSFSEVVIQSNTRHLTTANSFMGNAISETDNRFSSVTTFLRKNGIIIHLGNFQSVYQVAVAKKDLTLFEKKFQIIDTANPIRIVDETTHEELFIDENVKNNHIYEYRCIYFTKSGRQMFGTGKSIIEYKQLIDNAAIVKVSQPVMTVNEIGETDVKFNVASELSDTNVSTLVDILKSQGLDSYFTNDISANRERLKNVIVYNIDRVDLTMGEINSFGIFKGGEFSDITRGVLNNTQRLSMNRDYRYVISVLSRDSESLIPTITRTLIDKNTNSAYTFKPSKILHPTTLRTGTIRSSQQIEQSDVVEEFNAGFIGVQLFVDISTKTPKPKLIAGSCVKNTRMNCEIRWKLIGQQSQIDHFAITCEQLGMKSIVGRVHGMSPNNSYLYEDAVYSQLAGDTIYYVTPIFSDYTMGDELEIGTSYTTDNKVKSV